MLFVCASEDATCVCFVQPRGVDTSALVANVWVHAAGVVGPTNATDVQALFLNGAPSTNQKLREQVLSVLADLKIGG
eukprot:8508876-Pyramimonas_sp.AAC.1